MGRDAVVIISGAGGFTVNWSVWLEILPSASVTLNVSEPLLAPVGVPEMSPVVGFSAKPKGSEPEVMVQVNGELPPVSARVAL